MRSLRSGPVKLLVPLSLLLVAAKPNVVLITADTLRADHVSCYGYFRPTSPAVDRLAGNGVLFERAVAPMATTLPSHASIMTSSYPVRHGILTNFRFFYRPVPSDSLKTAAQLFKGIGYATAGFTSSSPLSKITGIDAGFDTFEGPPPYDTHARRIDIPAAETTDKALAWLARAKSPFFLWVHYFDPHDPYSPPAPFGRRFTGQPELLDFLRSLAVPPVLLANAASAVNFYDGEILYMDRQIARLLDALQRRRLYDDALIVFAADHGEGLWQHGYLRHGIVWNEQLQVPLIFKFPKGAQVKQGRSTQLASLIDILPTLVAVGQIDIPAEQFDGIDLTREVREYALSQREYRRGFWDDPVYTITSLKWKYHHYTKGSDLLFDLASDPHETTNVIDRHPEVAVRMKQHLLDLVARQRKRSTLRTEEVPESLREQLKALGYVE